MPAAEIVLRHEQIRALLADQCPQFASAPLVALAHGWDNVVYRLGDDLVVRLPRRAQAAALIEHEQRWLPRIAARLPLPVPVPVLSGRPGRGFPWPWSVCRFLPGVLAAETRLEPAAAADSLGAFVRALAVPAPADAPANPFRGVALAERDAGVERNLARLGGVVDVAAARAAWHAALDAPRWDGPAVWLHGDLHPGNLLVRHGRISAVIDFGDLTGGDPAADLAVAWTLLPAARRPRFRTAAGDCDDATWARAAGNALAHGLACLANSADQPLVHRIGARTVAAVLADAGRDRGLRSVPVDGDP